MKAVSRVLVVGVSLSLSPVVLAQAQEPPTMIVMGTYYRCTQGDEARADALFKEHVAPFLKAEQAAGRIVSFGWAKHRSGGDWRRLEYISGTDMDKLLDSRNGLIKMMQTPEHQKAMDEFDRVCSSHDDYVWGSQASSQAPDAVARVRSPFAMSTYYICHADETEADEIFKAVYAPVLNKRVADKKLVSWNWLDHRMGGKYRRVLVLDGADEKAVIQNWATLDADLDKASPALSRRFTSICESHSDYVWDMSGN